jgi:hypothetical protein
MEVENLMETDEDGLKMMTILHTALKSRQVTSYHLIPTLYLWTLKANKFFYVFLSGVKSHYVLDQSMISIWDMKKMLGGEAEHNPLDFTWTLMQGFYLYF